MLKNFIDNINAQNWRHAKILIAVSGGVDSMVMAYLFAQAKAYFARSPYGLAGFDFAIAHCNFQLRGADSDADEQLVADFAKQHEISFFVKKFDTQNIISESGGNVQTVARTLRYDWFETLRKELHFDAIATAHHQQDSVETLLINFFKGTGIAGLHGILPQQKRIIRPLLQFTKEAILDIAQEKNIPWRIDSSNEKDDYLRNKIRHHLLPEIENIFPNSVQSLFANTQRFAEIEIIYQQGIELYRKKLLQQRGKDFYIPIRKLIHCNPLPTILYELLKPFGIKPLQVDDVISILEKQSGHYVATGSHRIIKDRNFLIIAALDTAKTEHILISKESSIIDNGQFELHIKKLQSSPNFKNATAADLYVDENLLEFPLILRPWKEGDYFYPLGMGMKKKKVKKYLIDAKIPLHEKENCYVLESNKKIVWLVGMRADERFKIRKATKNILHFQYRIPKN